MALMIIVVDHSTGEKPAGLNLAATRVIRTVVFIY